MQSNVFRNFDTCLAERHGERSVFASARMQPKVLMPLLMENAQKKRYGGYHALPAAQNPRGRACDRSTKAQTD